MSIQDRQGNYQKYNTDGSTPVSLTGSLANVSDLVLVPFRAGFGQTDTSVANTNGASVNFMIGGYEDNSDGSGTGLYIAVKGGDNGLTGGSIVKNGARQIFTFYGTKLALRARRDGNQSPFTVAIDGVCYGVIDPRNLFFVLDGYSSIKDGMGIIPIDLDLPGGDTDMHICEIGLIPPPFSDTIASQTSIQLYGFMASRKAGYQDSPIVGAISSPSAVPTSAPLAINSIGNNIQAKGIRQIIYCNTSATPATISIYGNDKTVVAGNTAYIVWQKTIAAGDTQSLDFGMLTGILNGSSLGGGLTHISTVAGVNFTMIGGY